MFFDTDSELQLSFLNRNFESRVAYWTQAAYFEESVVCGLIWYIQVSLLHSGHLNDNITIECMKAQHPLMPFIYTEAVHLFNIFYQVKNTPDFVVLDFALYPQLNGYRGQIQSFNHRNGLFIVDVNTTECNSPTSPSSVVMQLCSQYMGPLHKVKNFGMINPGAQRSKEVVSLPNLLFGSDTRTPQITIKFYWKLFELVRKRFIRPEKTPKNQNINELRVELSKVNNQAILKNQQITGDKSNYTSLQFNFNSFKMPFQVCDQSLFKLGCDISFFELDKN